MTERFSRRTEVIEAEVKRLGITNAKTKGELGRHTRADKNADGLSTAQLRETWKSRLADDEHASVVASQSGQSGNSMDTIKAMDYAMAHCLERESALPERELLRTALNTSVGNAGVNEVRAELSRDDAIAASARAYVMSPPGPCYAKKSP